MFLIDKAFSEIRKNLGGNLELVINSAAALPEPVFDFLKVCSGAAVVSGYGMTEGNTHILLCSSTQKMNSP